MIDICEELVKFTLLTRDVSAYLSDRYSERKEDAAKLEQRVSSSRSESGQAKGARISNVIEIQLTAASARCIAISMVIEKAASQLEALGNVTRLSIYRTLVRAGEDGLPVGRLQETLDVPASTLSHHLKRLVDTGLVVQDRQATTLICTANYRNMNALIGYLVDECCADAGCVKRPEVTAV